MQLVIDPTGGVAGDMFAAALISAGADEKLMIDAMLLAAHKIGDATIEVNTTDDGAKRLTMQVEHHHGHLSGHKAYHLLEHIFEDLKIEGLYRDFGFKALDILVKAEIKAHKENTFLTDHIHSHTHHHHEHDHHHSHSHHHDHDHPHEDAYLHEAQDILIDITGAAYGLQLLNSPTEAVLTNAVSWGGGHITFSHGHMPVPAPATKIIFDTNELPGVMGPIDVELCTPTGSSILAALKAKTDSDIKGEILKTGISRGGKDLPIPPLKIEIWK
ncbi:nickel insertion protein [Carboxylicivirga caseinilyticus]|uniref:nickel insertion protein n=1 Tax=Carboxylicivirga caseinilyticus TaxID=3417572 RepID=UPI003D333BE8|nr:DUF111 family protein [Marinilabiliaceae bacterium A049]